MIKYFPKLDYLKKNFIILAYSDKGLKVVSQEV